jgi:hypothetical protein
METAQTRGWRVVGAVPVRMRRKSLARQLAARPVMVSTSAVRDQVVPEAAQEPEVRRSRLRVGVVPRT